MESHLIQDDILVDRTNAQSGRPMRAPLIVTNQSQRKGLFARSGPPDSRSSEPHTANTSLPSLNNISSIAPAQPSASSRIPRFGGARHSPPQTRKSFGLTDAFRMAEEEDEQKNAAELASPSPAPRLRPWRAACSPSVGPNPAPSNSPATETKYLRTRRSRYDSPSQESPSGGPSAPGMTRPHGDDLSDSDPDIDQKILQHGLEQEAFGERAVGDNDFTSRAASGTRAAGVGNALVRRASGGFLERDSPLTSAWRQAARSNGIGTAIPGRLAERGSDALKSPRSAGRDTAGGPSQRFGDAPKLRPATIPPDFLALADKNVSWQVEADFTAHDIQLSNSPPVSLGRRMNQKIDNIQALEAAVSLRVSVSPKTATHNRPRNTRIDDIRALEQDTARHLLIQQDSSTAEHHEKPTLYTKQSMRETENAGRFRRNQQIGRAATKIDDLQAQERDVEIHSRKQGATAKLDELSEQNPVPGSRSPSPIVLRTPGRETHPEPPAAIPQGREKVPALPQQRSATRTARTLPLPSVRVQATQLNRGHGSNQSQQHTLASESRDTAARGNLPISTQRPVAVKTSRPATTPPLATDARDIVEMGEAAEPVHCGSFTSEVGTNAKVVGHTRNPSPDSSDKGPELAHSESDPTERIQGEMLLFEPQENQSERGISRATSPQPDEDEEAEETPRPIKTDPLVLATPQVTGAYVDTPTTARLGDSALANATPKPEALSPAALEVADPETALHHTNLSPRRGRRTSFVPRATKQTLSAKGDRKGGGRPLSVSRHRRGKSLPRARSPALMNSAKPPTVHEDLVEIHRMHQIEDSTLDEFDELVEGHEAELGEEFSAAIKKNPQTLSERERELEAYDRMSKTLKTGLLGIRTAKQGIERLQDQVSHSDVKKRRLSGDKQDTANELPACPSSDKSTAYLQIPVPQLWRRAPKFRFTILGMGVLLFMLWYVAECGICYMYCRPTYCYSGHLCNWSPDDPNWGYSLPVKLDQWVLSGQGRALVRQVRPDVQDWIANLWDVATGTDITQVNTRGFNLDQKRQYRRRLLKRGLLKPVQEPADEKPLYDAWRAARLAREQADSAREMGYGQETFLSDDRMAADESV